MTTKKPNFIVKFDGKEYSEEEQRTKFSYWTFYYVFNENVCETRLRKI